MSNIFITGGTGFLGSQLIVEFLSYGDDNIYALVRGKDIVEVENRLFSILKELGNSNGLEEKIRTRIKVITGDITKRFLGLDKKMLNGLVHNIDSIFHLAAITDLHVPWRQIKIVNVDGTKNVLDFAMLCNKKKAMKVSHVSTAYVVGTKRCKFLEDELDIDQTFNNTYERSKYEAEKVVNRYRRRLNIDIFRPSIILGRYTDGKATKFKMLYQPLHIFSLELFDVIPAMENAKAALINVDIAARTIYLISKLSNKKNANYHINSPKMPTFGYVLALASGYFGFRKPQFITPEEISMHESFSPVKQKIIEPYYPYFNQFTVFDMKNTLNQLKQVNFEFPEFNEDNIIRLFEYCDKVGFIKRKRKSVIKG